MDQPRLKAAHAFSANLRMGKAAIFLASLVVFLLACTGSCKDGR